MKKVLRIVKDVAVVYFSHPVGRSAAALSYYLTLTIFPFFICTSVILGSLNIQESDAFELLEGVVPDAAFSTISDYLSYIANSRTELMLIIGLTAMLTSSSAAFRTFTGITGEIQGKMRFSGIWGWIISFVFSMLFLAAIYGSALVVVSGEWLMNLLEQHFHISTITSLWRWTRFIILFLLLFAVICSIYFISAPKRATKMSRIPGAVAAAVVLVIASVLFSQMISASIRYEVLYGSLASFIILMVWLYVCSFILIMANVINISINKIKEADIVDKLSETGNEASTG
ncbi:MAG: YihY/virulence factor BrkB family protein [Oscillospiraceae bacterium]|nr:YihY/virulence factor BrkB family protein [Oscillospiraceae bacterium]